MKITNLRFALCAVAVMACLLAKPANATGQEPSNQHEGADPMDEVAKRLEQIVQSAGEEINFSGVVLAELHGKVIVHTAAGMRNRESHLPNTPDTLFEIASITKPIVVLAVLALADQGKLGLNDRIAEHLPGVPAACEGITIRHLIEHTSGMPGTNYGIHTRSIDEFAPAALAGGPAHEPGTHYEYWNQGYALLSGIIERTSGMEFQQAVRELVFNPAGLTHACFTGDEVMGDLPVAIGYPAEQAPPRSALEPPYGDFYGYQYKGMGGVVISAGELCQLFQALRDGKILREATRESYFTLSPGWRKEKLSDTQDRIYMPGAVRGFLAPVAWYPEDRGMLIVLSNSSGPEVFQAAIVLREQFEKAFVVPPECRRFDETFSSSITGTYTLGTRTLTVTREGEQIEMVINWGGPVTPGWLEKRAEDRYWFCTSNPEEIEISRSDDGQVQGIRILEQEYVRKNAPAR